MVRKVVVFPLFQLLGKASRAEIPPFVLFFPKGLPALSGLPPQTVVGVAVSSAPQKHPLQGSAPRRGQGALKLRRVFGV